MNIAIVGATGNVGRKMLEVLEQKKISIDQLFLVASPRSAGQKVNFNGKEHEIFNLETYDFSKAEITFFAAGGKISEKYAKKDILFPTFAKSLNLKIPKKPLNSCHRENL